MLGEKRLPNTLVRLIEPFVSRTSGNFRDQKNDQKNGNGNGKYPDILSLSYIEKSALSMVIFLRNTCICGTSELRYQLNLICNAGINLQNEILQIQNQYFQQNEYSVNRENRDLSNNISEKLNGRNKKIVLVLFTIVILVVVAIMFFVNSTNKSIELVSKKMGNIDWQPEQNSYKWISENQIVVNYSYPFYDDFDIYDIKKMSRSKLKFEYTIPPRNKKQF